MVLENYKGRPAEKYGLDYDSLKQIKPDLIVLLGYRPYQNGLTLIVLATIFIVQGMGGFMSLTGERDDQPGGGPQKAGVAIADLMTACTRQLQSCGRPHAPRSDRRRPIYRYGLA